MLIWLSFFCVGFNIWMRLLRRFFRLGFLFSLNLFCVSLFILCLWLRFVLLSCFFIALFLFIALTWRFGFSHRFLSLYYARFIFFLNIHRFNIDLLCAGLFCLLCLLFRVIFFGWLIIFVFKMLFIVFLFDFFDFRKMNLGFGNCLSVLLLLSFWSFYLLIGNIEIHIISNFAEDLIIVIENITD